MSHHRDNVWYRLGYAFERARAHVPDAARLRSPGERRASHRAEAETRTHGTGRPPLRSEAPTRASWDATIAAATATLAGRLLYALPSRRRPGPLRLLRAGAAGAGAALLRELLRPLVSGVPREAPLTKDAVQAALAGGARGLLYGTLVEPRIPGPSLVRGAAYGSLEYMVSPWGGLIALAGMRAPHRSIPFLADLLEDVEEDRGSLFDHLVFGIALATLSGASTGKDG